MKLGPQTPVTAGQVSKPELQAKPQPPAELVEAAKQMEATFVQMMLGEMRKTVPKSEMDLESGASEIYRSMLDREYAQIAARTGSFGLSDQIVEFVMRNSYTKNR